MSFFFLLFGCTKETTKLYSNISKEDEQYISVHYPITSSKKLNTILDRTIEEKYHSFLSLSKYSKKKEFNVSSKFYENDSYLSVILSFFSYSDRMISSSSSIFPLSLIKRKKSN